MYMIVCAYDFRPASFYPPPAPVRRRGRGGALVPARRRTLSCLAARAQRAARGARDRAGRPPRREGPEARPSDGEGARARGEGTARAPLRGRPRGGGASVLLLDDGHCFREQALAFCSSAKARELEFRATSLSTLVQMVAGGAGVTLLPALSVPTEARRADIEIRAFAEPAPHRTIAL